MVIVFSILSCQETLTLFDFKGNINPLDDQSPTKLNLKTIFYQYNNKVVLQWDSIPNTEIYYVYTFPHKTGQIKKNTEPTKHTTKSRITITQDTVRMYFVVQAISKDKKVLITSNKIEGRIIQAPQFIESSKPYFYKIVLKWSHVLGGKEYTVRRREKTGGDFITIATLHASKSQIEQGFIEYEDRADIKSATVYIYEIKAQAFDNLEKPLGSSIMEKELQTIRQDAPNKPNRFSVSKYEYAEKIVLKWEDPENLDVFIKEQEKEGITKEEIIPLPYRIYRRVKSDAETIRVFSPIYYGVSRSNNGVYTYEDTGINGEDVYEYKVVALNKAKEKAKEGEESNILEGGLIPVPKIKNIIKIYLDDDRSQQKIRLYWDAHEDFKEEPALEVWRAFKGGTFLKIREGIKGSFYDSDISGMYKATYEYKIRYASFIDTNSKGLFSDVFEYGYNPSEAAVDPDNPDKKSTKDNEKDIADKNILELLEFKVEGGWKDKVRLLWKPLEDYSDDAYLIERIDTTEEQDGVVHRVIKYPNIHLNRVTTDGNTYIEAFITGLQSNGKEWGFLGVGDRRYEQGLKEKTSLIKYFRIGVRLKDERTIRGEIYPVELFSFEGDVIASKGYKRDKILVKWNSVAGATTYSISSRWKIADDLPRYYEETVEHEPQNGNIQSITIDKPDSVPNLFAGAQVVIKVEARGKDFLEDSKRVYTRSAKGTIFGAYGINFEASNGLLNEIQLRWAAIENAESYLIIRREKESVNMYEIARVQASEAEGGKFLYIDSSENSIEDRNIPALDDSVYIEYEYSIIPEKTGVVNPYSSDVRIGSLFSPPRNIRASIGVPVDKVIISWDSVKGAFGYKIYYSDSGDSAYILKVEDGIDYFKEDSNGRLIYEDTSILESDSGIRFYKVVSFNKNRVESPFPRNPVKGSILSIVRNVQASDRSALLGYSKDKPQASQWNSKGVYVVNNEAELAEDYVDYKSREPIQDLNHDRHFGFATKITWDPVEGADRYYIYRLDFNEQENFWNKIAEIIIGDSPAYSSKRVFYDARTFILREYRAVYWIVAVAKGDNNNLYMDQSFVSQGNDVIHSNIKLSEQYNPATVGREIKAMISNPNVDVGDRQITHFEYTNWALWNIGSAVRRIGAAWWHSGSGFAFMRSSSFGIANLWAGDAVYELHKVNTARLKDHSHIPDYKKEIVIDTQKSYPTVFSFSSFRGSLVGSGTQKTPGWSDVILDSRAGRYYSHKNSKILIESPYGRAYMSFYNVHHDLAQGTIRLKWEMRFGNKTTLYNRVYSFGGSLYYPNIFPAFNYEYDFVFSRVYSQYVPLKEKRSKNNKVIVKKYLKK